jgi:NAD(P)-dependent dehydrogenase (short-subunit alcohol dehydrogenase family)
VSAAFVTGGGGGLGTALGWGFARRGVPVALADNNVDNARQAALEIEAATDTRAIGLGCDVTSRDAVHAAWSEASEALGPIDAVVNNAGRFIPTDFLDISVEQWNETLAINLTGAFHVSQRAVREWVERETKGSIVNVASIAALVAAPGGADYGASKAGMVGLTIHLAVAYGQYGIRVNAVAPGVFRSPINVERLQRPGEEEKSTSISPMRRIASADEIAATVIHLALDASFVNGVVVPCDGGTTVVM